MFLLPAAGNACKSDEGCHGLVQSRGFVQRLRLPGGYATWLPDIGFAPIMLARMNNAASWIEPTSGLANVPLSTERVLAVARGFLLLFWSVAFTVLLALNMIQIPAMSQLQVPTHILGLCIGYVGSLFLRKGGDLTPQWRPRTRDAAVLLFVQIYLAPFSRWWLDAPHSAYHSANMLAMVVGAAWLFYSLNMLAAEWGRVNRHTDFRIECELAAWTCAFVALLPTLSVLSRTLAAVSVGDDSPPTAHGLDNTWLRRIELLYPYPFIVTALVMWRARNLALRRCRLINQSPTRTEVAYHEKAF